MLRQYFILLLLLIFISPASATQDEYWEYTFRPGDSIWSIAKKYTTSVNNWSEIQKINQVRQGHDRKIRPGTRIIIPVSMLKLQPTPALVVALNGNIKLIRSNGKIETISTDTKLYSGDRIITANQQSLRLQFADRSELQIFPNSEVVLDKISLHKQTGMVDTRIRLNTGSIDTQVKKQGAESRYEITTPSAITSVRGTSFRMSSDSEQISRTEVTGGAVTVTAGASEKEVIDGYGIVAEKNKPLAEPVKLLSSPDLTVTQPANMTQATINWPVLDGAIYYRYQVATDEYFNQISIDTISKKNTIELTTLTVSNYYLRVRAIDQYKLEGIDAVKSFEIKPTPPPPPPPPVEDDSYWKIIMSIGALILIL